MLEQTFISISKNYSNDQLLIEKCWHEIEKKYVEKKRYYHNLSHLQHLLNELLACKEQVRQWDMVAFALFYHDIIYDPAKKDNEELSAGFAGEKLLALAVSKENIRICKEHILATKSHVPSLNTDTNLFTDADLSILGSEWSDYQLYYQKIRKEYRLYPDFIYKMGRKKVLEHFLQMKRIFKSDFFFFKYETHARQNLQQELNLLAR